MARLIAPLFLGGCPRAGTTLAVDLLGLHPALSPVYETNFVLQLSELLFEGAGLSPLVTGQAVMTAMEKWSRDLPFRPHEKKDYERYWHGPHHVLFDRPYAMRCAKELAEGLFSRDPAEAFRGFVFSLFDQHARLDGKPGWINKTPRYALVLPRLKAIFPEMKFVHCLRDPRDAVPSILSRKWGERHGLPGAVQLWTESVEGARRFKARWPQDYAETRLEDLVAMPERETNRILQALGLEECPAERFADYRRRIAFDRHRVSGENRDPNASREIEALAGGLMAEFGYS
jgi:hypothetical protein